MKQSWASTLIFPCEKQHETVFFLLHFAIFLLGRILGSIVVSISACHAEDPGSIPGRGALFLPVEINWWNARLGACGICFLFFQLKVKLLCVFFCLMQLSVFLSLSTVCGSLMHCKASQQKKRERKRSRTLDKTNLPPTSPLTKATHLPFSTVLHTTASSLAMTTNNDTEN